MIKLDMIQIVEF